MTDSTPAGAPGTNGAAPAAATPEPAPAPPAAVGDAPEIEISFPAFDVFKARQGKVIRNPGDKTHDIAEIRDVNAVATYAARCAIIAVTKVNDTMFEYHNAKLEAVTNGLIQAIQLAIVQYDKQRRAAVWHRRQLGIRFAGVLESLRGLGMELGLISPVAAAAPEIAMVPATDPAVVGAIGDSGKDATPTTPAEAR